MNGFETLKEEQQQLQRKFEEIAQSGDRHLACRAKFALAASLPYQVCLNEQRLAAADEADSIEMVFGAAVNALSNMLAFTCQHVIADGLSQRQAFKLLGAAINEEVLAIFTKWEMDGTTPLPVRFDRSGREVPFDARAMMKSKDA